MEEIFVAVVVRNFMLKHTHLKSGAATEESSPSNDVSAELSAAENDESASFENTKLSHDQQHVSNVRCFSIFIVQFTDMLRGF